jgi:16S rRNA (adenine1518-N6/adenine1519-N6)-dimethyltransferase
MTPSEIKHVLSQIGGGANKRLGQHFLIDKAALTSIVQTVDIKKGDRVLEVGPGLGVLTRALLEAGADVTAIERDRRFVEYLRNIGANIIQGDAAKMDWEEIVGDRPWKFVANLPYSITSLALRKALYSKNPPKNLVVLVQREVAERAIARDGKTSLLSLMVALASSSAKIVKRVPAGAFYPPPKVESCILQIIPMTQEERLEKWDVDPEFIMSIAKKGFAHPRKLLVSNLGLKEIAVEGVSEKARPEELSPADWAQLANILAET